MTFVYTKEIIFIVSKGLTESGRKRPPIPGQEFVEPVSRVPGNAGEHVGEIGLRIDTCELGRLDERGDAGPVGRALVMAGEECIFCD